MTGYEPLIDMIELPDRDDRHVLAAAIRCDASVIVTLNLGDFPSQALGKFSIEAQHPDEPSRQSHESRKAGRPVPGRTRRARSKSERDSPS